MEWLRHTWRAHGLQGNGYLLARSQSKVHLFYESDNEQWLDPETSQVGGRDHNRMASAVAERLPLPSLRSGQALGSSRRPPFGNQDSPDPEARLLSPFQHSLTLCASSCHPMPEFAGFHPILCRALQYFTQSFVGVCRADSTDVLLDTYYRHPNEAAMTRLKGIVLSSRILRSAFNTFHDQGSRRETEAVE